MKLTKSFEQGLCIMILIAKNPDSRLSSRDFQRLLDISMTYSQKILRKLVIAGLIKSAPGANGGFTLAKQPTEISVMDIVSAIDGELSSYTDSGMLGDRINGNTTASVIKTFDIADGIWRHTVSATKLSELI